MGTFAFCSKFRTYRETGRCQGSFRKLIRQGGRGNNSW